MKKFLLLCFATLISSAVFAQNADLQDVVHLKNGSIIRGTIIEQVPGESLKIETRDGNVFVYKMDEIDKMTREKSAASFGMRPKFEAKPKGYAGFVEAGYGIGVGGGSTIGRRYTDRFELDVVNGYQFNPYCFIGLGIGFNISANGHNVISMPLFIQGRFNLMDRNTSPFLALNLGYNIATDGKEKIDYNTHVRSSGGLMFEPTFGVTVRVSNKAAMTFGVGFSLLQFKYNAEGYYADDYGNVSLMTKAVRLKIGVTF